MQNQNIDINNLKLDVEFILSKGKPISTADSLEDVVPVSWSKDVLEGKAKSKTLIKSLKPNISQR